VKHAFQDESRLLPEMGAKQIGTCKPGARRTEKLSSNGSPGQSFRAGRPCPLPQGNGATDKVAIKVDGEDSPLSPVTSAPYDDGPSYEDVIVVNSDDTTLTLLSHDHSLLTASSCVKLTSARMQCSLRAASYMYAIHIAVDQHALLVV